MFHIFLNVDFVLETLFSITDAKQHKCLLSIGNTTYDCRANCSDPKQPHDKSEVEVLLQPVAPLSTTVCFQSYIGQSNLIEI